MCVRVSRACAHACKCTCLSVCSCTHSSVLFKKVRFEINRYDMNLVTVSGKIFTVLSFIHGAYCFYQYTYWSPLFVWWRERAGGASLRYGRVCRVCCVSFFFPVLLHCQLQKSVNSLCSFCPYLVVHLQLCVKKLFHLSIVSWYPVALL